MNYNIVITSLFSKKLKKLNKKYKKIKEDFHSCVTELETDPLAGTSLGNGLYKSRLKSSDISKGKSGGFRIIYYVVTDDHKLFLLTIYSKSDMETVHMPEIKKMLLQLNTTKQ